jgi:hypothetical protein
LREKVLIQLKLIILGFVLVATRARHSPRKVFEIVAEALAVLVKQEF